MEARGGNGRIALEVLEAPQSDVGMGRARIDAKTRKTLGVSESEIMDLPTIIEIVGKKSTAATLFRLTPEDEGKGIIRIDGVVRRNAGVDIGDKVELRRAEVVPAERVTIAPIMSGGHKISFGQGIENFVKRGLLKRPLTKGDVVIVPGIALIGGALPFMIMTAAPDGIVQVADSTSLSVREEPVLLHEGSTPNDIVAAFTRGLRESLQRSEYEINGLNGDLGKRVREARARILAILEDIDEGSAKSPSEDA